MGARNVRARIYGAANPTAVSATTTSGGYVSPLVLRIKTTYLRATELLFPRYHSVGLPLYTWREDGVSQS